MKKKRSIIGIVKIAAAFAVRLIASILLGDVYNHVYNLLWNIDPQDED